MHFGVCVTVIIIILFIISLIFRKSHSSQQTHDQDNKENNMQTINKPVTNKVHKLAWLQVPRMYKFL